MTASEGTYARSARWRDAIRQITRREIAELRPEPRYATVHSIDRVGRRCEVKYDPDDVDTVPVKMGVIQPSATGQVVKVDGLSGDRFITDVMGVAYVDGEQALPNRLLAAGSEVTANLTVPFSQSPASSYPSGLTTFQANNSDGSTWPGNGYVTVETWGASHYTNDNRTYQRATDTLGEAFTRSATGAGWLPWRTALDSKGSAGYGATPRKFRDLAAFGVNTNPITGAFVVHTSFTGGNYMSILKTSIFSYTSGQSFAEVIQSGYWRGVGLNTGTASGWNKRGNLPISQVSHGHDPAGKFCVVIGQVADIWKHPKISVDEWQPGYSTVPAEASQGWWVELVTDLTGYDLITLTEYP